MLYVAGYFPLWLMELIPEWGLPSPLSQPPLCFAGWTLASYFLIYGRSMTFGQWSTVITTGCILNGGILLFHLIVSASRVFGIKLTCWSRVGLEIELVDQGLDRIELISSGTWNEISGYSQLPNLCNVRTCLQHTHIHAYVFSFSTCSELPSEQGLISLFVLEHIRQSWLYVFIATQSDTISVTYACIQTIGTHWIVGSRCHDSWHPSWHFTLTAVGNYHRRNFGLIYFSHVSRVPFFPEECVSFVDLFYVPVVTWHHTLYVSPLILWRI